MTDLEKLFGMDRSEGEMRHDLAMQAADALLIVRFHSDVERQIFARALCRQFGADAHPDADHVTPAEVDIFDLPGNCTGIEIDAVGIRQLIDATPAPDIAGRNPIRLGGSICAAIRSEPDSIERLFQHLDDGWKMIGRRDWFRDVVIEPDILDELVMLDS